MTRAHTVVVGIGNRYRGDDALGCIVARELARRAPQGVQCIEHDGEPAALMECWRGATRLVLVDTVSSGARPGHIFRFDLTRRALPEEFNLYSTHAFGVPQAVELSRALGTLPPHAWFYGVEGCCFEAGQELSPDISRAGQILVSEILELLSSRGPDHARTVSDGRPVA